VANEEHIYSLRALPVASALAPGPHVFFQEKWGEWIPFEFYIWVAQSRSRTLVIDTGFPKGPALETLQDNVRKLGRQSGYDRIRHADEALRSIQIDPADVTDVIVTSFVLHSSGGVDLFPKATIHLSERGWQDFWSPELPHPFARNVFFTEEALDWLIHRWDRVNLLPAEATPLPGIRTFWTGCHRRSSTAVSISTKVGRVVVFEPAFMYENIERNVPIGGPEALADWYTAVERAKKEIELGGILLPQHDPRLLDRYADGIIVP
jgi:glyoxylase-like metal-dependent hydrolase (beta-lactamase superfamily II)